MKDKAGLKKTNESFAKTHNVERTLYLGTKLSCL